MESATLSWSPLPSFSSILPSILGEDNVSWGGSGGQSSLSTLPSGSTWRACTVRATIIIFFAVQLDLVSGECIHTAKKYLWPNPLTPKYFEANDKSFWVARKSARGTGPDLPCMYSLDPPPPIPPFISTACQPVENGQHELLDFWGCSWLPEL